MSELRVTAIVPVHNGAGTLGKTLRSIDAQVRLPDELVVIFDGSTDESEAVLDYFVASRPTDYPVRVIKQDNQGQSAARNAAALAATGDLLAFLDQDDLWHPEHLEVLAEPFEESPLLGWCYSDFDQMDGSGNVIVRSYIHENGLHHPKTSIYQLLRTDIMVIPSASVISRTAFDSVGGFDDRLIGYEDDDLFIRMFRADFGLSFVNRSLTGFRSHANSSSTRSSFRRSRMIFFAKFAELLPDDLRNNRMYVSDLLVPRLLHSSLNEYSTALALGLLTEAKAIAADVSILSAAGRASARRRLGIRMLRHPRFAIAVLSINDHLPGFLRTELPAGLELR